MNGKFYKHRVCRSELEHEICDFFLELVELVRSLCIVGYLQVSEYVSDAFLVPFWVQLGRTVRESFHAANKGGLLSEVVGPGLRGVAQGFFHILESLAQTVVSDTFLKSPVTRES